MQRILSAALLAAALVAMPLAAPAQPAAPAAADSKQAKKPLTPGQAAARERQKTCAAEWKQAKADGKVDKGMTWPKFWSACNKRLKAAR